MAQLPDWQPLDGIQAPDGAGSGRVIAVLASEKAVASGWAAKATLDLARSWSQGGEKVIVADGALHYPTLHKLAQIENAEGLSDAALFGASVRRVAKPLAGESFFLITAGTAVANANTVPTSPRWSRLLEGFREAGVKLLLFVRDGDSGCAAFLGSASDIVILSDRGEKPPAAIRDLEDKVRAVGGPGVAKPAAGAPSARPKPMAGPASRGRPGAPAQAGASDSSQARPPVDWTAEGEGGRQRIVLIGVAFAVLIVIVVMGFLSIDLSGVVTPE